jgi:deoxyadenosine/deoxycytidine kinase
MFKRYEEMQESSAEVILFERSLKCMRDVFLDFNRSLLENVDYTFLSHLISLGEKAHEGDQVQMSIYMTCSDDEMLKRVRARAREEEAPAT